MTQATPEPTDPRVLVLPASGGPQVGSPDEGAPTGESDGRRREDLGSMVEQPAKVMRIGTMVKQLLDEVRSAPLDEAARARLAEIHGRSLTELEEGLSPELVDELRRITLPFVADDAPSDAELRIAQAQLVGWLEGLFHGLQTAIVAQQMAAQQQITGLRRGLPPGGQRGMVVPVAGQGQPGQPGQPGDERPGPGQYL
ncbi:bacterial proteasome activator family protein [Cellulomonas marina]|uniref:bacterial proteasome activator family protein n=1 Tax=Cellulomonas marina TaxID=988821 RepID=UPI0023B216C4|nr:bacterial proteasome activator family protein [Cellulomonas marina]